MGKSKRHGVRDDDNADDSVDQPQVLKVRVQALARGRHGKGTTKPKQRSQAKLFQRRVC